MSSWWAWTIRAKAASSPAAARVISAAPPSSPRLVTAVIPYRCSARGQVIHPAPLLRGSCPALSLGSRVANSSTISREGRQDLVGGLHPHVRTRILRETGHGAWAYQPALFPTARPQEVQNVPVRRTISALVLTMIVFAGCSASGATTAPTTAPATAPASAAAGSASASSVTIGTATSPSPG